MPSGWRAWKLEICVIVGSGAMVTALVVMAIVCIRAPSAGEVLEKSKHITYTCRKCRRLFNCPKPMKRVVKCPLCDSGEARPAWQCNNRAYHRQRGEHPYVFPRVVSKKVFPWVLDNKSKVRLSRATGHERTDEFWALRDMILEEYPKCPKCGWQPGYGYTESPFTRHWGVEMHLAPDAPVFECEPLDGPDAYPGPSPAEIVQYWMRHGRLPAGTAGLPAQQPVQATAAEDPIVNDGIRASESVQRRSPGSDGGAEGEN